MSVDIEENSRRYFKKCWKCKSTNTFVTTPFPYDQESDIYVACCRRCTSWSFIREPRIIKRIKKSAKDKRLYQKRIKEDQAVEKSNVAPEFTMDFTQGLDSN